MSNAREITTNAGSDKPHAMPLSVAWLNADWYKITRHGQGPQLMLMLNHGDGCWRVESALDTPKKNVQEFLIV